MAVGAESGMCCVLEDRIGNANGARMGGGNFMIGPLRWMMEPAIVESNLGGIDGKKPRKRETRNGDFCVADG